MKDIIAKLESWFYVLLFLKYGNFETVKLYDPTTTPSPYFYSSKVAMAILK